MPMQQNSVSLGISYIVEKVFVQKPDEHFMLYLLMSSIFQFSEILPLSNLFLQTTFQRLLKLSSLLNLKVAYILREQNISQAKRKIIKLKCFCLICLSVFVPVLSKFENHIQALILYLNCIHKYEWNGAIKFSLLSTML